MAWRGTVKKAMTPAQFETYLDGLTGFTWTPEFIVLHNTAVPSLKQRPDGFMKTHIEALEGYYRDDRGWSAGPHLFIDDHVIWVFSPLTYPGTHSPSWNRTAIGIEMLGDYAKEEFTSGRGAAVRGNAVAAVAALSARLRFKPDGWKFHLQDPKTDHDCPGIKARSDRDNLVRDIAAAMSLSASKAKVRPWDLISADSTFKKA